MPFIERNTFRNEWVCITYSCHSAANREQFSIRAGETRDSEGNDANKKIMQRASSISRTASINVGYLKPKINPCLPSEFPSRAPLFNDVI